MNRWVMVYKICVCMNETLKYRTLIDIKNYFYMYDSRHMLLSVG